MPRTSYRVGYRKLILVGLISILPLPICFQVNSDASGPLRASVPLKSETSNLNSAPFLTPPGPFDRKTLLQDHEDAQDALPPGLATDSAGNIFIANIESFLNTCPASDPAAAQIRSDFQIRRNGTVVGDIACAEPASQIPIAQYTDELILLQVLRVIYYMDRGKSGHLPWTGGTLYNWMKSKIKGINIIDGSGSFCCDTFDGGLFVGMRTFDDFNRDFKRKWEGISASIDLTAHETRHVDGFPHTSCCGVTNGCDQTYDQNNLSPYAVQWWLNKSWLVGDIDVGFACSSPSRVQEIANWHLSATNSQFSSRFCDTKPPVLAIPASPGGPCVMAGPDFSLGFAQSSVTAQAGTKARVTVNISRTGGFSGNVTVTPPDPAMGVSAKPPDPVTTSDPSASFKLKIKATAPTGPHSLTFTGRDDSGKVRTAVLTLIVQ